MTVITFFLCFLFYAIPMPALAWTDDPLTTTTAIRSIHVTEIRSAIDVKNQSISRPLVQWQDRQIYPTNSRIRAAHIQEMRTALVDLYTAVGLPPPTFTDGTLTPGSTPIRAIHIIELRSAIDNFVVARVNGSCGSANGTTVATAPTTNLCAAGTSTPVTGTGPWSWSCVGTFGGTTAACAANRAVTTGRWVFIRTSHSRMNSCPSGSLSTLTCSIGARCGRRVGKNQVDEYECR